MTLQNVGDKVVIGSVRYCRKLVVNLSLVRCDTVESWWSSCRWSVGDTAESWWSSCRWYGVLYRIKNSLLPVGDGRFN